MSAAAETPSPLIPIIDLLTSTFSKIEHGFNSIPGSPIVIRYIKSSYQVCTHCLNVGIVSFQSAHVMTSC